MIPLTAVVSPSLAYHTYARWQQSPTAWDMQKAVTTFQRNDTIVELHAQLHFGTAEYFEYYNSGSFNAQRDAMLYELLTDDTLLEPLDDNHHLR
jgi:hypothetical protein